MRLLITFGTFFVVLPFILVYYVPFLHEAFPTWGDKFGFVGMAFTVYGFYIGLIAVYQFLKNSAKRIEPVLHFEGGEERIQVKSQQFPFEVDIPFYVFNKGNVSIQYDAANYKLLFPKTVQIRAIEGITTENGTMILPTHSQTYMYSNQVQTLGADIPAKIFPKRSRRIFILRMTFTQPGEYGVRYYFTTDEGFFPRNVILRRNEPAGNLGLVTLQVRRG